MSNTIVDEDYVLAVLREAYPGENELRPDVVDAAARMVATSEKEIDFATTNEGDPFLSPETILLIIQAATLVATVVKIALDLHTLKAAVVKERAAAAEPELASMPVAEVEKVIIVMRARAPRGK